jgi:hypothetical protein
MSIDITVSLPDAICQRAENWAQQSGQSLPDFLAGAIESSLLPLGNAPPDVRILSDDEVLKAADVSMPATADRRLTELLAMQREATLDAAQRCELASLMQAYQEGLVLKAAATSEVVRRGLRGPLEP